MATPPPGFAGAQPGLQLLRSLNVVNDEAKSRVCSDNCAIAWRGRFWQCPRRLEAGGRPKSKEFHCAGRASVRQVKSRGYSMTALWIIVLCGALAIAFAIWATQSVMASDAGSARRQAISAAVREGAQAYLKRQYTTIAIVGIVIFLIVGYFLGWLVA